MRGAERKERGPVSPDERATDLRALFAKARPAGIFIAQWLELGLNNVRAASVRAAGSVLGCTGLVYITDVLL
jgi:hypothetical protein